MHYQNYLSHDNPVVTIKVKNFGTIKLEKIHWGILTVKFSFPLTPWHICNYLLLTNHFLQEKSSNSKLL